MAQKNFGIADPQTLLGHALARSKLDDFREALEMGADAARQCDNHVSVFESALSTPGCAKFVQECLVRGCDPNHINPYWERPAISYAVESRDPQILQTLLSYEGVQVNCKYQEQTPLNALAKSINADNKQNVCECIKLLLRYGASPNKPDQREMTPLNYILKNRGIDEMTKRELVQLFVAQPCLDVDTYRDGEVRSILQTQYADLLDGLAQPTGDTVDIDILLKHLGDEDEDAFLEKFNRYQHASDMNGTGVGGGANKKSDDCLQLLVESIRHGMHRAFDELLQRGHLDVNATYKSSTPIEYATIWGNFYALSKLLKQENVKIRQRELPLITVISKLNNPSTEVCNYRECFDILLDSGLADVNETDESGSTPLHYAVKYRDRRAIEQLLRHGAYIGMKSVFSDLAIDGIHLDLLEEHFDNCITTNGRNLGEQNLEILVQFKNLIPQQPSATSSAHATPYNFSEEMAPIAFIAESKEHRHLLQHPLITSFLFLKWHRFSVIFYINFLLYTFFAVSIIAHTVLKFRDSEYEALTILFGLFSWIGIAYLVIREIAQLIIAPFAYILSPTNYMEVALIVLSVMTCAEPSYDRETQRVIAVFTIMLVALELCLLVGSLPVLSISTHMLMLRAVSKSFIKSFALYSIFVITFSLCFYILFGKPTVDDQGVPNPDEGSSFNKFADPFTAIIKTIVMMTGEFDAGDMDFDTLYSYMVFLLFVVFMSIVLFNLLNGLAVSDTQAIKAQAELNGSICRTNVLTRYEQVLSGRTGRANFILRQEPFRSICRRLMTIYPNYISQRHIAILPNDGNKVRIPVAMAPKVEHMVRGDDVRNSKTKFLTTNESGNETKLLESPLSCCCPCLKGKGAEMDRRTVKLAMAVIEQKRNAQVGRQRVESNERRLQNIEQQLEKVLQLLQAKQ